MLASAMAVVSAGTKVVLSHDVGGTFVLEVEAGCGSDACRGWTPFSAAGDEFGSLLDGRGSFCKNVEGRCLRCGGGSGSG